MRFALHALEVLVVRSRSLLARRARIIPSAIATDSMERASLLTSSRSSGNVLVYRGAPIEEGPQILPDKMSSFEPGARPQRGQRCSRRRAAPINCATLPKSRTKSDHVRTSSGRSSMRSTHRARLLSPDAPFGPIPVWETAAISTADSKLCSTMTSRNSNIEQIIESQGISFDNHFFDVVFRCERPVSRLAIERA
jgi:hypothetical protein